MVFRLLCSPPCLAGKGKVGAEAGTESYQADGIDGLALRTLDIFAGVGGLSAGMEQAGKPEPAATTAVLAAYPCSPWWLSARVCLTSSNALASANTSHWLHLQWAVTQ